MTTFRSTLCAALLGTLVLGACSTEKIADNTSDAVVFVGKTAVKGAVGAGKLAVRGGRAAIAKARESRAEKTDFPPGTPVCLNEAGGYYRALENEAGQLVCLPVAR
jgi:hypothetical protein